MLFYILVIGIPLAIGLTKLLHRIRQIELRLKNRDRSLKFLEDYVKEKEKN